MTTIEQPLHHLAIRRIAGPTAWAAVMITVWTFGTVRVTQAGLEEIIDPTLRRVVKLYGTGAGREKGYACGIIVSDDGQVLTVTALLLESHDLLAVAHDGTRFRATVIDRDDGLQLALLQLHSIDPDADTAATGELTDPFDHFSLEASVVPHAGDWVIAAGNPFRVAVGDEPVSISMGVVTGRVRLHATRRNRDFPYYGEVIVVDASTSNPGSPGGALVDIDGHLVGMIGRVVKSKTTNTLVSYAMPTDVLRDFLKQSLANVAAGVLAGRAKDSDPRPDAKSDLRPSSTRLFHGIKLFSLGYKTDLPFVERVVRRSPAATAGIRRDDLIRAIDGQTVRNAADFDRLLSQYVPGDVVEVLVIRGETPITISLRLQSRH